MKVKYLQSLSDKWVEATLTEIRLQTIGGTDVVVHEGDIDEYISFKDNPISRDSSSDSSKPRYSVSCDDKWYGLDDSLKPVTDGYRTHKELKKSLDVDSVKGYTIGNEKYYALIYPPSEE